MDFIYTHSKKSQITDIHLAERQYKLPVRFFRTDGETSLGNKINAATAERGIITERSAPVTQAQNGATERAGGLIILKARCMREESKLPAVCGQKSSKQPPILATGPPSADLVGRRRTLVSSRVYGCGAYPLDKHILKKQKLQPRAHLGYLTGYDSTNIFRVWIPTEDRTDTGRYIRRDAFLRPY